MAHSALTVPPVVASITALEPLSITPMFTENNARLNKAYSMATDRLNLSSRTSAVVNARNRRIMGAISQ